MNKEMNFINERRQEMLDKLIKYYNSHTYFDVSYVVYNPYEIILNIRFRGIRFNQTVRTEDLNYGEDFYKFIIKKGIDFYVNNYIIKKKKVAEKNDN